MMATGLGFPTIFLLPAHFDEVDELPELESQIPTLTYDINEAEVILGKVARKPRALLELRSRQVFTDDIQPTLPDGRDAAGNNEKMENSTVQVVRLAWFTDSLAEGKVLPVDDYLVYRGRKKAPPSNQPPPKTKAILKRARDDDTNNHPELQSQSKHAYHKQRPRSAHAKRPHLVQESTSEYERATQLPPIPDYLLTEYSCQRPTLKNSPNDAFIEQLKKMRTLRTLEADEVGVRAYSTSIATVAAYPYLLSSAAEVARLPGCGPKIVELYRQWKENDCLDDTEEAANDPRMKVILRFHNIWGVGAKTANDFYNRGWRDLDDIVEFGWDTITRPQQIGIKYYEELQERIPRAEVEGIAAIILEHANNIQNGFQMVIVGGYRRGNATSGDADVVLSHPDPSATEFFINKIVTALEKARYITHLLTVSDKNSQRGQTAVSWKGEDRKAGSGFDTLDKALVVWQERDWDTTKTSKNPHPHRRVDIIVTPWRTAGCAVVGWTGGTTFERDLRRYCKKRKRLRFDSSGVRMREGGGDWVDLESDADGNPAPDMLTAERRLFENLGLDWRAPEERCTG
ncbi:putative DNA polymerase beta [Rosellinia necatrix]|uniref:DNA polymerase n=1 Tax=Rosellinia necatrix TaxID=77044 RepID=A0A1W2TQQ5_ROSNE|nr:putative DNA polymerase beta [Rosellinia necatrix]